MFFKSLLICNEHVLLFNEIFSYLLTNFVHTIKHNENKSLKNNNKFG